MKCLQALLTEYQVSTTDTLKVAPCYVEGVAFAWFAEQRWLEKAAPLKTVTGAKKDAIVGAIYLP